MNDNKLSPVTVYVPVYPNKILFTPNDNIYSIIKETGDSVVINHPEGVLNCIYNWQSVKEQSSYVFDREELEKFIFDTLQNFDEKYNYTPGMKLLGERKEYIQSLFNK